MNEYGYNGSNLKLQWQWNHNPNNNLWSLTDRKGWLRLKGGIRANNIREARNTLTQRTFGPQSSAVTYIDASGMKDGDYAGLTLWKNRSRLGQCAGADWDTFDAAKLMIFSETVAF